MKKYLLLAPLPLLGWFLLVQFHYGYPIELAENYIYGFASFFDKAQFLLYRSPTEFPWVNFLYNPLYFILCRQIMHGGGIPFTVDHVFWVGRSISVLSTLGTALIIYSVAKNLLRDPKLAGGVVLLYLLTFRVLFWSATLRPDTLETFLGFTALFIAYQGFLRAFRSRSHEILYLSLVPLFVAASVLAKQNVTFFLALGIWSFRFYRRLFWILGIGVVFVLGGISLWIDTATHHYFFWNTVLSVTRHGFKPLEGLRLILLSLAPSLPVLILSLHGWKKSWDEPRESLWSTFLIVELLWCAYAVQKDGADLNYFLNLFAVLPLTAAMALQSVVPWKQKLFRVALTLAFVETFAAFLILGGIVLPHEKVEYQNVLSVLRNEAPQKEYVYSESAVIAHLAHKQPLFLGAISTVFAFPENLEKLIQMTQAKEIAAFVFFGPKELDKLKLNEKDDRRLKEVFDQNYRLSQQFDRYRVYLPR